MQPDGKENDLSSLRLDKDKQFGDRPKSRKWLIPVWIIGLVAIAIAYFQVRENLTPATSVKVATATLLTGGSSQADLVATGYVVAQRKAEVASKGTGRLEFLGFEEGDRVLKGEVIARLDNEDIKAELELARAKLLQAEIDTLQSGRDFRRQKKLFDSGAITRAMMEDVESAYRASLAAYAGAVASVRSAEVALENTFIRAPFDGTILTKNADIGDIVAPFASSASSKGSVVTLADMSSLEVEADVSESYIHKVSVGQRCEIILDAYPSEIYKGSVKKIVPTADRARATVMTKVAFDAIDSKVLPEMSARVNFLISEAAADGQAVKQVLVVPNGAITSRQGATVVFVVGGEQVSQREVTVGRQLGDVTEILNGLDNGDRVVLMPPGKLSDNQKIKISN